MAWTPKDKPKTLPYRFQRIGEGNRINVVNVAVNVTVEFVWYPGAADVNQSLVDVNVPAVPPAAGQREVSYRWSRPGMSDIQGHMTTGAIDLPLAPGGTGVLTVFDTQWEIVRSAAGLQLDPVTGVQGIQQRLNALGYHLRQAGNADPGISGSNGPLTERALLAFQVDYRPQTGSADAPLRIRGELASHPEILPNLRFYTTGQVAAVDHSAEDSARTQAALKATVGA